MNELSKLSAVALQAIDLRTLMQTPASRSRAAAVLGKYMPKFEKAFPIPGEIETEETYVNYLLGTHPDWTLLAFVDDAENIRGGFHFQVLEVDGIVYAWGEHFWIESGENQTRYFLQALTHMQHMLEQRGVSRVFLEFNDVAKMNEEEIELDRSAGLDPVDRMRFWALLGAHELRVPTSGAADTHRPAKAWKLRPEHPDSAPYAQPSMGPEDPAVTFLTLAFIQLDGSPTGQHMERAHYQRLLAAALSTIPDVDFDTDQTCLEIVAALNSGPDRYEFRPLKERFISREELDTAVTA
jgi:hypothetical protein